MSGVAIPGQIEGGFGIDITPQGIISAGGASPAHPTFEGCVDVLPGTGRTAAVRALILAGAKHLCFGAGDYIFEGPILTGLTETQVSGLQLYGAGDGRTVFRQAYSPGVGLVDDPTQALLFFDGKPDGVVATSVAAGIAAIDGSLTFTVTSGVNIAAGMRLRLQGHNVPGLPNDALGMSDGANVVLTEMIEVASVSGGGPNAVVTCIAPLLQWHGPGISVVSIQPIRDVVIRRIYADFTQAVGDSTISNLLYSRCTDGIDVEDVWGRSFTRAVVEFGPGTRNSRAQGIRGRGLINGLLFGDSCMLLEWDDVHSDDNVERVHPLGIPRHLVFCQNRCTGGTRTHLFLQHASAGLCDYGGWHIHSDVLTVFDMDATPIHARNPLYSPVAYVGLGFESGAGPLGNESFAYDLTYDNVQLFDLFGGDFDWSCFWHDVINPVIGRISIANKGPIYGTVIDGRTYKMQGMLLNDLQGEPTLGEALISGTTFAWNCYGGTPVEVGLLAIDGPAGNGGASIGVYINNSIAPGGAPRFDRLRLTSLNGNRLLFGPSFALVPDFSFQIREYQVDQDKWQQARLVRNNDVGPVSFNVGDGIIFDPASAVGELGVITPTASGGRVDAVVCVGGPVDVGTGLIMVAPLPGRIQTVTASAAAIVPGDRLRGSGAGLRTFASIAGPAMNLAGDALVRKAAGAPGLVVIGPGAIPEVAPAYYNELAVDTGPIAAGVLCSQAFTSVGTHPCQIDVSCCIIQVGAVSAGHAGIELVVDGVVVAATDVNNGAAAQVIYPNMSFRIAALAPGPHLVQVVVALAAGAIFCRPVTQSEFAQLRIQEEYA